jgi:predicted transcriptional regulator
VCGVPRRKYGGDVLGQKALELRARGLSYREIARELGCSVFEVH